MAQEDIKALADAFRSLEHPGAPVTLYIAIISFVLIMIFIVVLIIVTGLFTWMLDVLENIPVLGARWFTTAIFILILFLVLIGGVIGLIFGLAAKRVNLTYEDIARVCKEQNLELKKKNAFL